VEDLREIYEIRRRLESMAVGHAVARLTASDLEALTELSREMEAAVARKEAERYVGLNYQFHMTLYEASRCKRLFKLINGLWSGIPPLAPMAVRGQLAQSFREHQALLDALKQRDRQAAEEAILAHISNAERSLLSSLQERGQQQNVLSLVQGEQP
jgi:DNA-binding GntR family transcriptional regulator